MNNKKLISVIMGIYNCSQTLEQAVDCLINQTYTNWELIMCDDGSTDNTYQIACELSHKDNRIKVIKNDENITLAPTLNRCIEFAKGEYIARMDGDDVCSADRFQKEYEFLENNPDYAFVSAWMELFDDGGVYRVIKYPEKPQVSDLAVKSQFCHACVMMRADELRKVGCYSTDKKYKRVEDYNLWVKFYEAGYKGYNLQESLYSMRDDINAFKRRNWQNRVNESNVISYICKRFDLPLKYRFYSVLPIIKYFVPAFVYEYIHRNR